MASPLLSKSGKALRGPSAPTGTGQAPVRLTSDCLRMPAVRGHVGQEHQGTDLSRYAGKLSQRCLPGQRSRCVNLVPAVAVWRNVLGGWKLVHRPVHIGVVRLEALAHRAKHSVPKHALLPVVREADPVLGHAFWHYGPADRDQL